MTGDGRRARRSWPFAGLLLVAMNAACGRPPPASRPSVVLIVVDTLRADRLGCYGYPGPSSPELDHLAAEGVRFTDVIAQSTWTRPSHGSMLTSLPPRTLGIYREEGDSLTADHLTLAEAFRAAGYSTIGVTANPNINGCYGFAQGFDAYVDSDVVFEFMQPVSDQRFLGPSDPLPGGAAVMRTALELIDRMAGPYYVQLNLMEVHQARRLRELDRHAALFPGEICAERRQIAQAVREVSLLVDTFVGELRARPVFEDMLVAVTSDHGDALESDHPHVSDPKSHGFLVYESHVKVPWILYTPGRGLPRDLVVSEPVQLLDLAPTLLDCAGLAVPAGFEGRSLLPMLESPARPVECPDAFVVETRFRGAHKLAAYTRDWKLVENLDGHPGTLALELQALGPEDGSATDRSAEHPELVQALVEWLEAWGATHPECPPTAAEQVQSTAAVRQLGAIGYGE